MKMPKNESSFEKRENWENEGTEHHAWAIVFHTWQAYSDIVWEAWKLENKNCVKIVRLCEKKSERIFD